ncbi:G-type lectin S-receptor-like serine/threonine-protein kinase LECRK1 [Coffea eugenioides]|uniref:G-type lectin S-receptor-like serine/threonine-protein kinase LECRK1 n=1 Tax=Coffea eugenioides TaxID=49369 RepID=UPI000F60D0E8|nr:G-type lectin S-receptor-like serine/threonine-protein kinase LECRK1 [Coffea eugenioides]
MASLTAVFWIFFLVTVSSETAVAQPDDLNMIPLGSSLFPVTQPTAWYSRSKRFAFGFFQTGEGYKVEIRIVGSGNGITVWTFNRDEPAVSSNATLDFVNGKLQLKHGNQYQTIADHPSKSALSACLLDSGNFVLYDENHALLWQSFEFPTDTILGGQILYSGRELISSLSQDDKSSGLFHLKMEYSGNLVAYRVDVTSETYWGMFNVSYSNNSQLILDNSTGTLSLIEPSDSSVVHVLASAISQIRGNIYRATLGYDGNFRLYTHSFDAVTLQFKMRTEWEAIDDLCDIKGICGFNSYCTSKDMEWNCSCIPGFNFIRDLSSLAINIYGCEKNFTGGMCINGKEDAARNSMTPVSILGEDRPYFQEYQGNQDDCMKSCSEDCDCDAATYSDLHCSRYRLPLMYLSNATFTSSIAFIKSPNPQNDHLKKEVSWLTFFAMSLSFVTYSSVVLACFGIFMFKFHVLKYKKLLLQTRTTGLIKEFTLQTYTYNELKKATKGFKQELGKGAFGAVHRGSFDKGKSFVAVKRLEKVVEEGEREFRAEMRAIGRTRHRNLVQLLGYCIEGPKRLLVYELMVNGSLADLLFKGRLHPNWNDRVQIALDIARGILYLHEGCEAPIIHCDIKPQNILLDQFWTAKISDFGLAKLLMPDQTRTDTGARGTRGYMAPEWNKNIPISVKVDVYSFGIVLLEIICCRKNLQVNLAIPEATLLSGWAYQCFAAKELDKLVSWEEVDKTAFERMLKVALWCIQDEPALRFPMKIVLRMLEGLVDVPIPPCPSHE